MKKRRFIAGAVCPRCHLEDRTVISDSGRECVACGFKEALPKNESSTEKPFQFLGTPVQTLRLDAGSAATSARKKTTPANSSEDKDKNNDQP